MKQKINTNILETPKIESRATLKSNMPAWVDPDYGYDPENPRKPYMRENYESSSITE